MAVASTQAYYHAATITAVKSFFSTGSGACTLKHYGLVIYGKWTDFIVSKYRFYCQSQTQKL
jgi:hypothetical protein